MRGFAVVVLASLAAAFGWTAPAWASGDTGCTPRWTLALREATGCDNRLVLGPANDTRVNLFLLLRDRHRLPVQPSGNPQAPLLPHFEWMAYRDAWQPPAAAREAFTDGEGSRCRSNDDGRRAFAAAVRAARGLADDDRALLIAARDAFAPDCAQTLPPAAPAVARTARPWADYLVAAAAFYNGDFDRATAGFAGLTDAGDPWLAETARYMTARVELNRAQAPAFDDWGELDATKVDRPALARASTGFDRYLAAYPAGRYAGSARGLLRRVWWLGGDTARLAGAYAALLAQDAATRGIDDVALVQEIDNKLRPATLDAIADPLLLATFDLARMRAGDPVLTAAELTRQRPAFAREPALYGYLQAAFALYVTNQPAEVLRLIPDATRERGIAPVALSRQVLRGQALDAVGDANARGFWLTLLPAAGAPMQRAVVELGLALHEERAGHLDALLAPGSPLTTPVLRETLLFTVADAAMLRRAARSAEVPPHERAVALFQLLYKELSRGAYAAFGQDLALVPAAASTEPISWEGLLYTPNIPVGVFVRTDRLGDLGCPPLRATAARLAVDPRDPRGRLCVADFFQANDFDGGVYDEQPIAADLGGTRSLFPGKPYERAAVYRALLAEPGTPTDDKAYALYRAIRCYQPTGTNSCGGPEVPVAMRRAWFQRLQREFPRSRWARSPLYW